MGFCPIASLASTLTVGNRRAYWEVSILVRPVDRKQSWRSIWTIVLIGCQILFRFRSSIPDHSLIQYLSRIKPGKYIAGLPYWGQLSDGEIFRPFDPYLHEVAKHTIFLLLLISKPLCQFWHILIRLNKNLLFHCISQYPANALGDTPPTRPKIHYICPTTFWECLK